MKQFSIFLFLLVIFGPVYTQPDSASIYKNLETKKFYALSYSYVGNTYKVEGKNVSKSTYDRYHSTWENMVNCKPCFLQSYNQEDLLIREGVFYTDCGVGDFKEYYPNGKTVQLSGSYKENPTGDWENIFYRGYCNVRTGQWVYYDKKGDTLYSEFWDNGDFIKQIPEQETNEIWKIELTLDGESVQGKVLTITQVKQLVLTPKYKNSTASKTKLTVKLQASAIGYRQGEQTFASDHFNEVDIKAILKEAGIPAKAAPNYTVTVYNGDRMVGHFEFQISN